MHFDENFYFEARVIGSLDKEKFALAKAFKERINQIPAKLEDYVVALTPPIYWRKLSNRYPMMISTLHENMRVGVENEHAVMNSYVEGSAGHNLVLGAELLIASAPGAAGTPVGPTTTASGPKTIEEALLLKTSFSFDSISLEFAMRDLAEDVRTNLLKGSPLDFQIKIMGDDLELDGITRNQSVRDFKEENKTVAEVLTALVLKATAAKSPSDAGHKLLWVVTDDPDMAGKKVVLITTRQASEKKKYKIPAVFELKK